MKREYQIGDTVALTGKVSYVSATYVHVIPEGGTDSVLVAAGAIKLIHPHIEPGMQVLAGDVLYKVLAVANGRAWLFNEVVGDEMIAELKHLEVAPPDRLEVVEPVDDRIGADRCEPMVPRVGKPDPVRTSPTSYLLDPVAVSFIDPIEQGDRPDPFAVR